MFATVEAKLNHADYLLLDSKEKGREEGREEGIEIGEVRMRSKTRIAIQMITQHKTIHEIVENSNLTPEEVIELIYDMDKQDFYNLN